MKVTFAAVIFGLMFFTFAKADEVSSFCLMTETQAEVQRNILNYPEVFGSTGNPQTGNSSTITAGMRWSLSRYLQANTVSRLASASCDAYRADRQLAAQTQNVEQRADLQAIQAMEPLLRTALVMAGDEVNKEQKLMAAKVATLTDVNAAFNANNAIRTQLAALLQTRSRIQDQLPEAEAANDELVQKSIAAKSRVASETSHLAAQAGWDLSIAAGAQNDPSNASRTSPYVGLTVSYSLGSHAANRAANQVAAVTAQYLTEQHDGPVQQYQRAIATVRGLLESERLILQGIEERKAFIDTTVNRLQGIATDNGQRALRQARIEQQASNAQLAGSRARLDFFQQWLARNQPN